jgi:hypothetical protein
MRLGHISTSEDHAFKMMNELANILKLNFSYKLSLNYYRKALICIKRKHKNNFMKMWETSQILINIAIINMEL